MFTEKIFAGNYLCFKEDKMWKAVKHGAVLVVYNSNDEEVCGIAWLLCKSCLVYNRVCSRWEITINQNKN